MWIQEMDITLPSSELSQTNFKGVFEENEKSLCV